MSKKGVWVLTESYNDYDQHGEYFVAVFEKKPDVQCAREAQLVSPFEELHELLDALDSSCTSSEAAGGKVPRTGGMTSSSSSSSD